MEVKLEAEQHQVERAAEEEMKTREEAKEEEVKVQDECKEKEEKRPVVLYKGVNQRDVAQLQCPVHKGLMHDPVGTGKCKHVFCRSCLASWVELQGHCPLDSRPVVVDQLVPAESVAEKLNSLLIHCRVRVSLSSMWARASTYVGFAYSGELYRTPRQAHGQLRLATATARR
jgi:hypothetical protein